MATHTHQLLTAVLIAGIFLLTAYFGFADPTGATVLSNVTAGTPSQSAGSLTNPRGTVNTIVLDAVQQDQQWKAYVGNVTGRLSLDDASGNTVYDWSLSGGVSGEVYISRYSTLTFSNLSCANNGNITTENSFFNMTDSQSDSINRTFNYTDHDAFFVGTLQINADTCKSTATFVNDSRQSMDGTQNFQQIMLQDSSNRILFVTIIADNAYGFDNRTYDFQAIVPESDVNTTATTYYFWTELSG